MVWKSFVLLDMFCGTFNRKTLIIFRRYSTKPCTKVTKLVRVRENPYGPKAAAQLSVKPREVTKVGLSDVAKPILNVVKSVNEYLKYKGRFLHGYIKVSNFQWRLSFVGLRQLKLSSKKKSSEDPSTIHDNMERTHAESKLNFDARPPETVRGMKKLDREAFKKTVNYPSLIVSKKGISKLTRQLKKKILHLRKVKPLAFLEEGDPLFDSHKLLLFDPKLITQVEDFNDNEKDLLKAAGVDFDSFQYTEVDLEYENWTAQEVLRAILPENVDSVSGFESVGHIAHLNLKDEVLEYKYIIGEVLMDKTPSVKTVVNKLDIIDNTYRNFQMELLAGENNMVTTVKENEISYEFDFSKVFWNAKLGTEHERIVTTLSPGDVVYDVFAGVGPFAIPAAKKGVIVYANDLNPHSYESLKSNVIRNKVKKGEVHCYNLDGRDFIKTIMKKDLSERWASRDFPNASFHVLMNLPALAVDFLDAFRNLYLEHSERPSSVEQLPFVHCYCFSKSEDTKKDAQEKTESVLGEALPLDHKIRVVRNVAPNKYMLCVTFQISESVLFGKATEELKDEEPTEKKMKLNE